MKLFHAMAFSSILALCGLVAAHAQGTASITGTVRDPMGRGIYRARVTVSNSGVERYTITESHGEYVIDGLPPGEYTLSVSQRAFKKFESKKIVLEAGKKAHFDAYLLVDESNLTPDDFGFKTNDHEVVDVFFVDSNYGWIATRDHHLQQSLIFSTKDGGGTWTRTFTPEGVVRLFFLSGDLGWALKSDEKRGNGRPTYYVLRTTDGGRSWNQMSSVPFGEASVTDAVLDDLVFIDNEQGWTIGTGPVGHGLIMETLNAGKSFGRMPEIDHSVKAVYGIVATKKVGIWLYGDGCILHSADEGKTWKKPDDLANLEISLKSLAINSAIFSDGGRGWLVGNNIGDGIILATEDSGEHWRVALKSQTGGFGGVSFWDEKDGCAASSYPALLFCTQDGGLTWNSRGTLPPESESRAGGFKILVMLKSGMGWALRDGGFLYETANSGQNWHPLDLIAGPSKH